MDRILFISGMLLAALVHTHTAQAAETATGGSDDRLFNQFMLEQLETMNAKNKKKEQQTQAEIMEEFRARYPNLQLPENNFYTSLEFYNQTFDSSLTNTIFFSPGSSYLSDVQIQKLTSIADSMGESPELNLILEAHSSGNQQIEDAEERLFYNRWISGRRAVQVWNYLTRDKNIDANRIAMFAYDAQKPLNSGDNKNKRALNRRVELRLTNRPIALVPQKGRTTTITPVRRRTTNQ